MTDSIDPNSTVADAADAYADAQAAEKLRNQISHYATAAVHYAKVDRDWVNARLNRMGAPLVTGLARYQINVPITGSLGTTVTASTRAEALEKFQDVVENVKAASQVTGRYLGVYNVQFGDADPVFFTGPQDMEPYEGSVPGLDALKTAIRDMLKEGVTSQGWGHNYAVQAVAEMGLEALPALHTKTVEVPVSGTTQIGVLVFSDADDETIQASAAAMVARSAHLSVKPEEVGEATWTRPDSMGLILVDDDDEDNTPY